MVFCTLSVPGTMGFIAIRDLSAAHFHSRVVCHDSAYVGRCGGRFEEGASDCLNCLSKRGSGKSGQVRRPVLASAACEGSVGTMTAAMDLCSDLPLCVQFI